jgi:hypothetical protein
VYDGATTYTGDDITIGSLTNKVSDDTVSVSVTSTTYNSPDVAAAHQIPIVYAISGADVGNYTAPANGTIPATITKAAGAAVSAPIASATTIDSVTVTAVNAPTNGQTVEYAVSTESDGTGLSAWQNGIGFTDLSAGTKYYVYARSASNANYNAGTSSVSGAIPTKQEAGFTITFNQIAEEAPSIEGFSLSKSGTKPLTVTDPEQYSSIEWYVDGVLRRTGETFTLNAANYSTGGHFITLEVVKNGLRYNTTITFTVAN